MQWVVTLELILSRCTFFLVTKLWLFFPLQISHYGGLQSQGINAPSSSPVFFYPEMQTVILGNGYFSTTVCSAGAGLRPLGARCWLLNSHRATWIAWFLVVPSLSNQAVQGGASVRRCRLPWIPFILFYFIFFFGLTNPVKPLGHCLDTELALGSLCWEVCINRRSAVSVLLLH